jgi:nicotinamide mononucleotide transporter
VAGVVSGVLYVWLAIRESPWCWPSGILSALCYVVVFGHARLPGQATLQGLYVGVSVYGWWRWLRGAGGEGPLLVSRAPRAALAWLALLCAVLTVAVALFLAREAESVLPWWDGGILALSLAAQWMAARKWLENWSVWVVVNVLSVGLYLSQGLYPTVALYAFFLVMAVVGHRQWRLSLEQRRAGEVAARARTGEPA